MIERVGYLISSHAGYTRPLARLLASMAAIPAGDILVVIGGCSQEDASFDRYGTRVLRVRHNSYDYTALIGWFDHPYVWTAPEHLFLLHDTCELGPNADQLIRQADPGLPATAVWGGQCNLMLLQRGYVQLCASQLLQLRNCSKRQAIAFEGVLWQQLHPDARGSYPGQCINEGIAQPYDGADRIVERYTGVDLIKYKANWGQNTTEAEAGYVVQP